MEVPEQIETLSRACVIRPLAFQLKAGQKSLLVAPESQLGQFAGAQYHTVRARFTKAVQAHRCSVNLHVAARNFSFPLAPKCGELNMLQQTVNACLLNH